MIYVLGTLLWVVLAGVVVFAFLRTRNRPRCPSCGLTVDRGLERCPHCSAAMS